jgi:mannose-6-phosphate isomerase-like protein (cupin superfamily)
MTARGARVGRALPWLTYRIPRRELEEDPMTKINLAEKLSLFHETWTPKIIGELNGQQVKLAKFKGEMVWHKHDGEDELFLVLRGRIEVDLPDRTLSLDEGEMCIVPRATMHRTRAVEEAHVMMFEPISTAHTGDVESELTVSKQSWI